MTIAGHHEACDVFEHDPDLGPSRKRCNCRCQANGCHRVRGSNDQPCSTNCFVVRPLSREYARCARRRESEGDVSARLGHHCHARGCMVPTQPEMLMCRRHWFMVPRPLRARVWATYRPGQCDDKAPSEAWHAAAVAAIAAVAEKEGKAKP